MRAFILPFAAAAFLFGCVSSGKYDDLKAKYDAAETALAGEKTHVGTLEQTVAEHDRTAQAQKLDLDAQIAELTRQRENHAQQIAAQLKTNQQLQTELAGLIKDRSRLKDSTSRLQQALADLARRKEEADRRVADFRALLDRFKRLIDAGQLRVQIMDGRMVLTMPSDVLFDSGSAKLSKVGKETVKSVAQVLATMSDKRFQVEGHTDNVPINNAQYASNWDLAAARALVVVKNMVDAGMPSQTLSAASYGEFHPAMSNDTAIDRAVNRRIEIVVVPDLSSLPGFEELQRAVAAPGAAPAS